jgi:P27 family predicted phage terminase small subunit
MSGVRQKHPDALQNKRGGRYKPLTLLPPSERTIPRCPKGLCAQARGYWKMLWASPVSAAWGEVDVIPLSRYIWYVDEWLATMQIVDEDGPLMEGRRGGVVLGPNARYIFRLEAVMRELEKSYGLDAMARLRLGVSLAKKWDPIAALKASPSVAEYKKRLGVEE